MKPVAKLACLFLPVIIFCESASAASTLHVYSVRNAVNEPGLKFESCYPRLDGICNQAEQNKLNVRLKETADTAELNARLAAIRLSAAGTGVEGTVSYDVRRNGSGVFSLTMNERLKAGARDSAVRQTAVTVSTVTGRCYRLADLFIPAADYENVLGSAVLSQIKSRAMEGRLTRPFRAVEPDDSFYLTRDSLVIFYRQGDYFPQECGVVEFTIPLAELNGCLKADLKL